jgi:membrane peptidoglycan carboxypeptidase
LCTAGRKTGEADGMADLVSGRIQRAEPRAGRDRTASLLCGIRALRWVVLLAGAVLLAWAASAEMRTAYLQSRIFSRLGEAMTWRIAPGPNRTILYPSGGPYDERLGYAALPSFIHSLEADHFAVTRQARWSPELRRFVADGGYAPYREKSRAGLKLYDSDGKPLYLAAYPQHVYPDFASIPPLVRNSLMFIEDRDLLQGGPDSDPAVDWKRFALAVVGRLAGVFDRHLRQGGASTLAVQIEKFRHSPGGRTPSAAEKLRQMVSAAIQAYRHGRNTMAARQRVLAEYLNSEPLGAWPGQGEIIGFREALWTWYGTDPDLADRVLREPATTHARIARKGEIYRQALSLLLSGRRPQYYLVDNHAALNRLTDRYLRLLAEEGVIPVELRDAALSAPLHFRTSLPPPKPIWYVGDKAEEWLRVDLLELLHQPDFYSLDRLDVSAQGTIDSPAQKRVTDVLTQLGDRHYVQSLGLVGRQLLGAADPGRVNWSVVLYERGRNHNYVRIHADSLDQPFDINSGARLQLGSTAKLRTLISYLDVIDALHSRLEALPRDRLLALARNAPDALTQWAARYLAGAGDKSLPAMLEAAMQRRYSGSPQAFLTDGGEEVFANFEKSENTQSYDVYDAFAYSVNNCFIRIMRDVVQYYVGQGNDDAKKLLTDPDDPQRLVYLKRFADREGREYLDRFYRAYQGLTPDEALDKLARRTLPLAKRLAVVFDTVHPNAQISDLAAFLQRYLPHAAISDDDMWDLYREYGDLSRFTWQDRGYLAGVHPLELWLVRYLQHHPGASHAQVVRASAAVRQEVYGWLFKPRSVYAQNIRIRELLQEDAFDKVAQDWHRQGYPFARLVPSYATAIGSSGDRPDALAKLMGIILHDGVKVPTVDLQRVHFAEGTPYDTEMTMAGHRERVFPAAIAEIVKRALLGVVSEGTARRVDGIYRAADGGTLPVGGKTGTGDNRFYHWGRDREVISQRVVDRTATFVFFLGDRYFGTITAYVPGAVAAQYQFTSALAVQMLKALQPQLQPLPRQGDAAAVGASTPPPRVAPASPTRRPRALPVDYGD